MNLNMIRNTEQHKRNFVCDGGDSHRRFKVKFAIFQENPNRIFLATRRVLWPKTCRKCDSGRGSAPDPNPDPDPRGESSRRSTRPSIVWGGDTPPHIRPYSAPLARRCSRLQRLDRRAPLTPNPGDATGLTTTFQGKVAPMLNSEHWLTTNVQWIQMQSLSLLSTEIKGCFRVCLFVCLYVCMPDYWKSYNDNLQFFFEAWGWKKNNWFECILCQSESEYVFWTTSLWT